MTNHPIQKLVPVTANWKPNLAFRMRVSAEQTRAWVIFHKRRNWMERCGHPVRYGDRAANSEIEALGAKIQNLHRYFIEWVHGDAKRLDSGRIRLPITDAMYSTWIEQDLRAAIDSAQLNPANEQPTAHQPAPEATEKDPQVDPANETNGSSSRHAGRKEVGRVEEK